MKVQAEKFSTAFLFRTGNSQDAKIRKKSFSFIAKFLIFSQLEGKCFNKGYKARMRRKKLSSDYNAVNHSQMIDERRRGKKGGKNSIAIFLSITQRTQAQHLLANFPQFLV